MSTKVEATIEDLYKVEGKAELVNGEIILMSPTGLRPSYCGRGNLYPHYAITGKSINWDGLSLTTPGLLWTCRIGNRLVQTLRFYSGEFTMKFGKGAPIFAAEVRSDGDYGPRAERQMAQKRADYFAAGTLVVWDVDLLSEDVVRVYRASDPTAPNYLQTRSTRRSRTSAAGLDHASRRPLSIRKKAKNQLQLVLSSSFSLCSSSLKAELKTQSTLNAGGLCCRILRFVDLLDGSQ